MNTIKALILLSVVPKGLCGMCIGGNRWHCPDPYLFCLVVALLFFACLCMVHDDFWDEGVQHKAAFMF